MAHLLRWFTELKDGATSMATSNLGRAKSSWPHTQLQRDPFGEIKDFGVCRVPTNQNIKIPKPKFLVKILLKTYCCVLRREWEWMGCWGLLGWLLLVTSYCGSFPRSLLSTSKDAAACRKLFLWSWRLVVGHSTFRCSAERKGWAGITYLWKVPKNKMGDLQQQITNDTGIFHGI